MQFLQANSSLIFFGLALVFMMWMHSGGGHRHGTGGGCGMGHEDHARDEQDPHQTGPSVEVVDVAKPDPSEPLTPIATGTGERIAGCH